MHLSADTINRGASGPPLVHVFDETVELGVDGVLDQISIGAAAVDLCSSKAYEVVVVDVQLDAGIGGSCGFECNADKGLA
jgi:hypothetical protein